MMDNITSLDEINMLAKTYIYNLVFWAPPWKEIFVKSPERPQEWAFSKKNGLLLKDIYSGLGYNVIELPKVSVEKRVRFLLQFLDSN
jgi:predicted ATPase